MFIDLPMDGQDLRQCLFSDDMNKKGYKEKMYFVLGVLSNSSDYYYASKSKIYTLDEFFSLPDFDSINKYLTNYAVANVDGACFELSPNKKPLDYDFVISMAEEDEFAGEISLDILELYAYAIFKKVVKVYDQEDECYYLIERW